MAKRTCSVEGCEAPHKCRGWCDKHYRRWRQHGDPTKTLHRETCSIEGCGGKHEARGWCNLHYTRWRQHGDPLHVEVILGDDAARFERYVDRTDYCWLWTGTITATGYGQFYWDGVNNGAHRFAYEHFVGPIPEGMTIDHVCHSIDDSCHGGMTCPHRRCVNPDHLEVVTVRENVMRGNTLQAENAARTHCIHGHPFDEANTGYDARGGWRFCKACQRRRTRESYRRTRR